MTITIEELNPKRVTSLRDMGYSDAEILDYIGPDTLHAAQRVKSFNPARVARLRGMGYDDIEMVQYLDRH